MLTLHGFPYSNYHNIVKHVLMWKGIPFEEHIVYPNTPELLAFNPTGKVPAMTTTKGTNLGESSVLAEYLEDAFPEPALFPSDIEARGRVRQLMKISELYLDLAPRLMMPAVFANLSIDQATKDEARAGLDRAVRSLNELACFSPYLTGETLTLADIYLRYTLAIPKIVGPAHLDWDIMAEVDGLAEWDSTMADSDISRKIDEDTEANAAEFMEFLSNPQ